MILQKLNHICDCKLEHPSVFKLVKRLLNQIIKFTARIDLQVTTIARYKG